MKFLTIYYKIIYQDLWSELLRAFLQSRQVKSQRQRRNIHEMLQLFQRLLAYFFRFSRKNSNIQEPASCSRHPSAEKKVFFFSFVLERKAETETLQFFVILSLYSIIFCDESEDNFRQKHSGSYFGKQHNNINNKNKEEFFLSFLENSQTERIIEHTEIPIKFFLGKSGEHSKD